MAFQGISGVSVSLLFGAVLALTIPRVASAGDNSRTESIYDFTMKNIDGKDVPLSKYKGKVVLIVNVASRCGFTPQYKDLEALYRRYKERGFVILGFPANNFGSQEPGTNAEIKEFCSTTFGVTFDMFSKISVKGDDEHPLYRFITSKNTDPQFAGDIQWNFQKYLVSRDGKIVGKFLSAVKPLSEEVTGSIERELGEEVQ